MYSELSPSPFLVGPPVPALGELEQKEGLLGFAQLLFASGNCPIFKDLGGGGQFNALHYCGLQRLFPFLLPGT